MIKTLNLNIVLNTMREATRETGGTYVGILLYPYVY